MKRLPVILALALSWTAAASAQTQSGSDIARWQRQARNVTITRDDWGVAHVSGRTDADAVFGALYAQAEDDFSRVETNYINAMGRLAEAEGEAEVYRDLRMKLFINPDSMKAMYGRSPSWMKKLMVAYADGLNFYLYRHPAVVPRVIKRFEPWMALTFSEGSIGGDIERVNLRSLEEFYSRLHRTPFAGVPLSAPLDRGGSNGIAIAPSNTLSHHALFLINPHTSFFFRSELQMSSREGLNAYGASTWGQFFIYQGFNDRLGWMHTSSGVDNIDEYLETILRHGDTLRYRYGSEERPVVSSRIVVPFRTPTGMSSREFTVFRTHHGPIVREAGGKWVSIKLMEAPLKALTQSWLRTKAKSYKEFVRVMELHTNSSNNTVYADADGNIAYFHSNFIPRRDPKFDWIVPVDGSDPATEWKGVFGVTESPFLLNPKSGWLYNSNNAPWSAAGDYSQRKEDFPLYVDIGRESARGLHAVRVLSGKRNFTLESLIAAAYDSYMPAFATLIPPLLDAYDRAPQTDPLKERLSQQIATLRSWDYRWDVSSVATSLAVFWAEDLARRVAGDVRNAAPRLDAQGRHLTDDARRPSDAVDEYMVSGASGEQRLSALASASDKLVSDFGRWQTSWGEINRFQRLTDDIVHPFSDAAPSIPVGFTASRWGSLASFVAKAYPGTKKWYGTSGNSFVAAVEFGPHVRAKAITAGGESGDISSRHFNDQAGRYATGQLRDVYFYRDQLRGHTERVYHPGS